MTSGELIVTIIMLIFAGVCMLISILQFAEKGFLFNNAYIWTSKEERERMDKSPYYRQSAVVFSLVGAVFTVIGIAVILQNYKIQLLEIPLIIGAITYAIVSSAKIEKQTKR